MSTSWMSKDQFLMLETLRSTTHAEAVTVVTNATDELTSRQLIKPWVKQGFASTAEGLEIHNHPVPAWSYRMLTVKVGDNAEIIRLALDALKLSAGWPEMIRAEIRRRCALWNDIAHGRRPAYGVDMFAIAERARLAAHLRKLDDEQIAAANAENADIWIADFLASPTAASAVELLIGQTRHIDEALVESFPIAPPDAGMRRMGEEVARLLHVRDNRLSWAWRLWACDVDDQTRMEREVTCGFEIVNGSKLPSIPHDHSIARLRVWRRFARSKDDLRDVNLFASVMENWFDELPHIGQDSHRAFPAYRPPVCLLQEDRWDVALRELIKFTRKALHPDVSFRIDPDVFEGSQKEVRARIDKLVEHLFDEATTEAGELALGWQMMACWPGSPSRIQKVVPQLQHLLDMSLLSPEQRAGLQKRMDVWWNGASGTWHGSDVSLFRIAAIDEPTERTGFLAVRNALAKKERKAAMKEIAEADMEEIEAQRGPSLVVMPKDRSTKLDGNHSVHGAFKQLVDARLPLIVARDVQAIRRQLHAEYPHAIAAVDLVLRDLRQDKPVTLKPMLLVGGPGAGKSRLVRRLGELLKLYVFRYDGAAALDNMFGGISKGWSSSQPSAPARAVEQAKHANPIVMVDEIEKGAMVSTRNGSLHNAMMPFLEAETAKHFRDPSLDAELDLSRVTYVATANDDTPLPAPLKDRFRIIRVPDPTLAHLPQLAANVMREMAAGDESRMHDAALAGDELEIIGRAWRRAGLSMRKLQKIIAATLEARDQFSMRH